MGVGVGVGHEFVLIKLLSQAVGPVRPVEVSLRPFAPL